MSFVGYGFTNFMKSIFPTQDQKYFIKAKELFASKWHEQCDKKAILFDGVLETLEHFSDKIKGIVTNRRKQFAIMSLKNTGLYEKFQYISGADTLEEVKPNPGSIEKALDIFQIKKEEAVIIGDMDVDIEAGKNAGILTCAVTYGLQKQDFLKELMPDFMIDSLLELKEIFY